MIHLAMSHEGERVMLSGTDFLSVFKKAPKGCFLTTEVWLTAGDNRKAKLLEAINKVFLDYQYDHGQRVDIAIQTLRQMGVQCEVYTSRLLAESLYGQLPQGSVASMVIGITKGESQ